METTINKKITLEDMERVFENLSAIRYFKAKNFIESEHEKGKIYLFEINIRHNEKENPIQVFNNELKKPS